MLQKFSVKGFKNFSSKIELDLTSGNYTFNDEAVANNIVKTGVIYGENASGKSNLGLAIMDIITHLTDKEKKINEYKKHYLNLEESPDNAEFEYVFNFGGNIVKYKYQKKEFDNIIFEELLINDKLIVMLDKLKNDKYIYFSNEKNLVFGELRDDQSLVNLVYTYMTNSKNPEKLEEKVFNNFIEFVNSMLYFDSVFGASYQGFAVGNDVISEIIVKKNKVSEYQKFLSDLGIEYELITKTIDGDNRIFVKFGSGKEVDFFSIMSKGTRALSLFFTWYMRVPEGIKFMFIDEFDSYFHHKNSRKLIKMLKSLSIQIILTTHNTANMSNLVLRPDNYFNLLNGTIANIADRAGREIRQAQNIEKMYRAGSFDNE